MLKIDSNQVIKMSRGDDVKFPLFLNRGTLTAPVRYAFEENKGCEVYFYIWDYSDVEEHPWDHIDIYGYDPDTSNEYQPILIKTFTDDGHIYTMLNGEEQDTYENMPNINENGDMMIWLMNNDTKNIPQGSYIYQIKVKVIDSDIEPEIDEITGETVYHYIYNTVTNRLPIYIIDDNYGNRVWE